MLFSRLLSLVYYICGGYLAGELYAQGVLFWSAALGVVLLLSIAYDVQTILIKRGF